MKVITALFLSLNFSLVSCALAGGFGPLETVDYVEVERYLGKWYEIEKIPNRFQRDCGATEANYSLRNRGGIKVVNKCLRLKDGSLKVANGRATIANYETNAVLEVSFFFLQRWFGGPNYYILDLADDYSYVLVGSPNRDFLWILARTKTLDANIIENLKAKAQTQGFDTTRMVPTPVWPDQQN